MSSTRNRLAKAGLALAGATFHIAFYACVAVLMFWLGKQAYQFGYQVFNQQAMSPGDGQVVVVEIPQGADDLAVGEILQQNGLVENALVFCAQEFLSGYRGRFHTGTYQLSTAYTPTRIMGILAGEEEAS